MTENINVNFGAFYLGLFGFCVLSSFWGSVWYLKYASVHGPYAVPNHRSLHQKLIARGGGVIPACAVLFALGLFHFISKPDVNPWIYLGGGLVMAFAGYIDDRLELAAKTRLMVQVAAAVSLPLGLGLMRIQLGSILVPAWMATPLLLLITVWFYNLYNFVDGTDGMAATATIYIGTVIAVGLLLRGQFDLAVIAGMLAAANAGFIFFNWPPAKMFMGDSGTSFIAYVLSAVMWLSVARDPSIIWLWLTVGTVYFADTTTTTTTRLFTVRGWYKAHRSHAYQNLARVLGSHKKVLLWVLGIDFLWVAPLTASILVFPNHAPLLTLVSYMPVVLLAFRFGPRYENK